MHDYLLSSDKKKVRVDWNTIISIGILSYDNVVTDVTGTAMWYSLSLSYDNLNPYLQSGKQRTRTKTLASLQI
jgi:hypothetical protein